MSTHAPVETEARPYTASRDGREQDVRPTYTETKSGFKTSEFYVMLLFVVGVLIAAYADGDDALTRDTGWLFATLAVTGYIVSRGLAKLATHEPYGDRDR
jgi:hypothetical protein